ncbi:stalk domain-containing protein [Paenibacillus cymbidii]|uniref:stalk domain-containing protein n=1 Tax=Paenibacillus cymbidii TaxID=1639034 RepID=UPI0010812519|nr:stalk domain-containing protein [Paenibacillus cymbidii]
MGKDAMAVQMPGRFRRIRFVLIGLALLFAACWKLSAVQAADDDTATVTIDGIVQRYEQTPVIVDGTTMVPLRAIFEALGARIEWDTQTSTVIARKEFKQVTLTIGKTQAFIDSTEKTLDQPAMLVNGSTMVPLRFVSTAFGAEVGWDGETRTVSIRTGLPGIGPKGQDRSYPLLEPVAEPDRTAITPAKPPAVYPAVKSAYNTPHWFDMRRQWKTFTTSYFQVYYYEDEADVMTIATRFDDIYRHLAGVFGRQLFYRVPVYFMNEEDYKASHKDISFSAAHWNLGEQTMFVRIAPDRSLDSLLETFRHEMTHALTLSTTESGLYGEPSWFPEAVAGYYETIGPYLDLSREKVLYAAWKENKLLAWKEIPESNADWDDSNVQLIYAEAQSFYRYLVDTYGESKTNELYYAKAPFANALLTLTGKTPDELESTWRADLGRQYGAATPRRQGIVTYAGRGNRYVGEVVYGEAGGQGNIYSDYKLIYTGELEGGKMNGEGTLYYSNGGKAVGTFKDDKLNGSGKQYGTDDKLRYEGSFADGKIDGPGTYYLPNGDTFEGVSEAGSFKRGKYTLADRFLLYEGDFASDKFSGKGTLYFSNGYKFVGDFSNGKPDGRGVIYRLDGTYVEDAVYRNGERIN